MIKCKLDYEPQDKAKGTLLVMKKKQLRYNMITAGMMLTLVVSNPTTAYVYASENTALGQSAGTTTNIEISQEASEETTTEEATALADVMEISEEEIDAYFADSVFVGDSIMLGFRNYCMKQKDSFLNDIQFLAAGSFSVTNSLWDVNEKSVHPVYQGKKRQIWESISMMDVKRVFLFFGMNDLNVSGLEGTCEKYQQLISNIKEKSPDVEIHIISMTYTLKCAGKGKLKNNIIREFNVLLQDMAKDNGWGYMDMATPLADENGDLAEKYCSDGYVHQSRAAYDVWSTQIRDYARAQLDGTTEFPIGVPTSEDETVEEASMEETIVEEATTSQEVIKDTPSPRSASVSSAATSECSFEFRHTAGFSALATTTE